jgi:hypothetical protein
MIGIIKEVAPSSGIETDEELGVNEFQTKYFSFPLYRNQTLEFYNALGNRSLLSQLFTTNPCKLYSNYQSLKNRLKGRDLKGNYAGEGIKLGGVFVISPRDGIIYEYQEITGNPMPVDEIERAIQSFYLEKKSDYVPESPQNPLQKEGAEPSSRSAVSYSLQE